MSENFDGVGGNTSPSFEPSPSYERLIKLREESPDAFLLRTSEATRRALHHYERQKQVFDNETKTSQNLTIEEKKS
jgi:hypothetical protein